MDCKTAYSPGRKTAYIADYKIVGNSDCKTPSSKCLQYGLGDYTFMYFLTVLLRKGLCPHTDNDPNTVFKRSHLSEKCVQDENKRCGRSSIVLSKPFL